jgi:hypothetical protein
MAGRPSPGRPLTFPAPSQVPGILERRWPEAVTRLFASRTSVRMRRYENLPSEQTVSGVLRTDITGRRE